MELFTKVLSEKSIKVHTIWLDIECEKDSCSNWGVPDTDPPGTPKDNGGLARQWIKAIGSDMSSGKNGESIRHIEGKLATSI